MTTLPVTLPPNRLTPEHAAFLREFHDIPQAPKPAASNVQCHNKARSLLIIANGKAREKFYRQNGRWPAQSETDAMKASGEIRDVPPIARDSAEVASSKRAAPGALADQTLVNRVKKRELCRRTEKAWVDLVMEIEDDTLRLGVAKKVFWDFFGKKGWRGLDDILYEPNSTIVRFFSRHDHPDVDELRVTLWRMGYPISTIREFYPDDFISGAGKGFRWIFSSVQETT